MPLTNLTGDRGSGICELVCRMAFKPSYGIRTGGCYLMAIGENLVGSGLHQFAGNALTT